MPTLRRKLVVPTALLAVVVVGTLGLLAALAARQSGELARSVASVRATGALVAALTEAAQQEERWILSFHFRPDPAAADRIAQAEADVAALADRISALELEGRAADLWRQYVEGRFMLLRARDELIEVSRGDDSAALSLAYERWRLVADRADALLGSFSTFHVRRLERAVADVQRSQSEALRIAAAALAAGVLLAGAFAVLLGRAVVVPIASMAAAAERIAAGRGAEPVQGARRRDELGTLARAFNAMTERLVGANADLARAVRSRDAFLALLGHELRNPLSAITMAAELAARGAPAGVAPHTEVIRRQSRQLGRIVDDLLDVARVTTGRIQLQRAPVDLRALVRQHVASVVPAADASGHRLEGPGEGSPVVVDADTVRLEQMLANLVGNSLKFTPAGGRVDVEVAAEAGAAVLRVRDDGAGIAPELLERVFELFQQAPMSIDRKRGGLGLGLTLVRELARLHGGDVIAESAGPGQGSTFTVRLPLAAPGAIPAPPPAPAVAPARGARPLRLLVVEDQPDNRETLRDLLEVMGAEVVAAPDGPAAVALAVEERPDVALVDIGLPGFDGYEVARRTRAALGADVYLVALTGYGLPEDRARALEAGFDLHLTKPPDPHALARLLAERAAALPGERAASAS